MSLDNEVRIAKQQINEFGIDDPRARAGVSEAAYKLAMIELVAAL